MNSRQIYHLFKICSVIVFLSVGAYGAQSGPFFVLITEIAQCPDEGSRQFYFHSYRMNRVDKSNVHFETNYTVLEEINNDHKGAIRMWVFGNGGWKDTLNLDFKHFCSDLMHYSKELYSELFKLTPNKGCPIPKGTYPINVTKMKYDVNIQQFQYGKYKVQYKMLGQENSLLGCLELTIEVKPKKKNKKGH